jgi:aminoglycoside phosphotransferase (APT) family kinase protein
LTVRPQWAPEHVVDVAIATDLVSSQFPFLRGAMVQPLAEGWDNTVFVVGSDWVFRFPRRAIALPGLHREIHVLPRLARHLPLPIPVPEFVGTPSDSYPWPFWGSRLLRGRELADVRLSDDSRSALATAVGAFLRVLHAPAQKAMVGAALPVDPNVRGDPSVRVPMAREPLVRLHRRGLWSPDARIERLLSEAEHLGPSRAEPVLAHGDLHVRHLLVDDHGSAAGVIDWGDVCLADRAIDLPLAYSAFSGSARAALFEAYGQQIDVECETRARVLAVGLSAVLADYAAHEGHDALLREALAGLKRATAE